MWKHSPWLVVGTAGALVVWQLFKKLAPPKGGIVESGRTPRGTQLYGVQRTPTHVHQGIDIGAPSGSKVYAAAAGTVGAVWPDGKVSGYGNTLVIFHPDNTQTLYAHLSAFAPGLAKGKPVVQGQWIGNVGTTQLPNPPMTSAPHLHFETQLGHTLAIREDNPRRVDPLAYLASHRMAVSA